MPRRRFLEASTGAAAIAWADGLFGPARAHAATPGPTPELIRLGEVALEAARKAGATYADIRITRYHTQEVSLRSTPDVATGKLNHVPSVSETQRFGFGVRVIAAGTWGFAASPLVNADAIARAARDAVAVAKANAALTRTPVRLAPVPAYVDRYTTPFRVNPFDIGVPDKLALLEKANSEAKGVREVFSSTSFVTRGSTHPSSTTKESFAAVTCCSPL